MGFGLQQVAIQLQAVIEAVTAAQRAGQIAIAIGIVLVTAGLRGFDIDAICIQTAQSQAVPTLACATGDSGAAAVVIVATVTSGEKRLGARA